LNYLYPQTGHSRTGFTMQNSNNNSKLPRPVPVTVPMDHPESGQIMVSLLFMLSIFLLAMVGFAVDFTNLWFHRQAAQSAADSACQAGAMDMYMDIYDVGPGLTPPSTGFTPGTAGNCSASSGASICFYANANGYNGTGLTSGASNSVAWSFPASVTGATAPSVSITTNPFLKVTVTENVKTYFLFTARGSSYQNVVASCTCGVVQEQNAAPVIVLSPTASGALTFKGTGTSLTIVGGPRRSLQVNSSDPAAISCGGLIDTSSGGPAHTGAEVGVVGGPAVEVSSSTSGCFYGGTTGQWHGSVVPISDPYSSLATPTKPAKASTATTTHTVTYGQDGCPDHSGSPCVEYEPGYYPNNLNLNGNVVIFKPGIYYMGNKLSILGNAEVRPATPCVPSCSPYSTTVWQQTDGVMFYFEKGTISIGGSSGTMPSTSVDPLNSTMLTCDGRAPDASLGMPSTLNGNILIGQCTANGTYWDTNGDTTDSRGTPGLRGLLFFQAHSNSSAAGFAGGGSLAFSGALYFHSTGYADTLTMNGSASSSTFAIGQIVTDQLTLTGGGGIKLALNPSSSTALLKVAMLQ
jgi:hypothetical protein